MAAGTTGAESAGDALVHDPDATTRSLALRDLADLPYDPAAFGADLPVMLDTSAYIDQLKGRLPGRILRFVAGRSLLHAGTALQEIAISIGMMDPGHPDTTRHRAPLLRLLETIRLRDCVAPSPAAWTEAGMLAGILARTQFGLARAKGTLSAEQACCQRGERRRLLNDALIFLTAQEQGAVLVTANRRDMDLLLRFGRGARVLLYNPGAV
ncbi:type II toxin-antitoxin system VapC family toxin [Falsiroseomonas algicola]|nr:hypothetical protein [Falsiroseomonas algicola]